MGQSICTSLLDGRSRNSQSYPPSRGFTEGLAGRIGNSAAGDCGCSLRPLLSILSSCRQRFPAGWPKPVAILFEEREVRVGNSCRVHVTISYNYNYFNNYKINTYIVQSSSIALRIVTSYNT